jgi:hypothetical protein
LDDAKKMRAEGEVHGLFVRRVDEMALLKGPAQGLAEAQHLGVVSRSIAHQEPDEWFARFRLRTP